MFTINTVAGPRQVSAQLLADAMDAGVQGIRYWCDPLRYVRTESSEYNTVTIRLHDEDELGNCPVQELNLELIRVGIERILSQPDPGDPPKNNAFANWLMIYRWLRDAVADNDATMIDADVADMVVQYGLFGEAVYG